MSKANTIVRYLLGVFIIFFGLNGFFGWVSPGEMGQTAGAFMGAFFGSGYGLVIKVLEVAGGIALLTNKFVRLALVILLAISVNAVLFHIFMAPQTIGGAALFLVLTGFLVFANFDWYKDLLKP